MKANQSMPMEGFSRDHQLEELVRLARRDDLQCMEPDRGRAAMLYRRAEPFGSEIWRKEEAERLMPIAKGMVSSLLASGRSPANGTVLLAGRLSSARGRFRRSWEAAPGGIYMVLAMTPSLTPPWSDLYAPVLGLSVAEVLREWGVDAEIRWINDVLIGGKKVAGILMEQQEMSGPHGTETWLFAGLGLNVNQEAFSPSLPWATSLALETGRPWPLTALMSAITARISINLALLHHWDAQRAELAGAGLEPPALPLLHTYRRLCRFLGKQVIYGQDADRHPEMTALACDIGERGQLILELDGRPIVVDSGEIRFY